MPFIRKAIVWLLILLFTALGVAWWIASASLPVVSGTLRAPGLRAPVLVERDEHGIPVIMAASSHDAFMALGFVHAQDRLFQMETMRRLGAGRLAEVVGERALPADRFARTLGLYALAQQSLEHLDDETRAALDAYAAGVNAFLDSGSWRPPELLLLRHHPEPWTPADSLVWGRLMGMTLSGNWREEIIALRLRQGLTPEQWGDLFPESMPQQASSVLPEPFTAALASNGFAVAPERSSSGGALLAGDPHLGFQAPILWYLAEIRTPEWRVAGATAPGVPFHLIGHNGRMAWTFTTTHSDTMDLFLEPRSALRESAEILALPGGASQSLTVRRGRHGPVINDLINDLPPLPPNTALTLAATALHPEDTTAQALYHLTRAHSWDAALVALESYHSPQQNILLASYTGAIGMVTPGRVPLRSGAHGGSGAHGDGLGPFADSAVTWTGWVPFEELPQTLNPESGVIINANNRPYGEDYPHRLARGWPEDYRARRSAEVLENRLGITPDDLQALQRDAVSLAARELTPLLTGFIDDSAPAALRQWAARLAAWDGTMAADKAEPLVFTAWALTLTKTLFAEPLGDSFTDWNTLRPSLLRRVLAGETAADWCAGDCAPLVVSALAEALNSLRQELGATESAWTWGSVHRLSVEHGLFRFVPLLGSLTTLSAPTDGGEFTVNRGGFHGGRGAAGASWQQRLAHRHGAGLRAVFDMANPWENSRYVLATGQSGHVLSPHYSDFFRLWKDGDLVPIGEDGSGTTLTLTP